MHQSGGKARARGRLRGREQPRRAAGISLSELGLSAGSLTHGRGPDQSPLRLSSLSQLGSEGQRDKWLPALQKTATFIPRDFVLLEDFVYRISTVY